MATILVVDDQGTHRAKLKRALARSGLFDRIVEARDAEQGFEQLHAQPIDVVLSSTAPKAAIDADKFSQYLLEKGKGKQIKERMMTQYWQINAEPLESKQYWKESEDWLREDD